MNRPLEEYCERELVFFEETAQAFAERYPAEAKHLVPEPGRSIDPHLERFVEGFALLAGRVRHKLDNDFPELTEGLLQILYPHLDLLIPSLAIAQAQLPDGTASAPRDRAGIHGPSWRLEKGAVAHSAQFGNETYHYRVGYPVEVWPIELKRASWETSPFDPALRPPAGTVAILRLRFACQDGLDFNHLAIDKLRLYLSGERQLIANLYEVLFNRCLGATFQSVDGSALPVALKARDCVQQVGLDLHEGLLPFPPESFPGYRYLMELLSFPQKYLFADVSGWEQIRGQGFGSEVEVIFFLSQSHQNLEKGVSERNFQLGCTPIINLFQKSAEPIDCNHRQSEYRVVPARRQPGGMEIYRIETVHAMDAHSTKSREIFPFYASTFGQPETRAPYYHASRRASTVEGIPGTEVYLAIVDPAFHPSKPSASVLDVQALCTNRDLPYKQQQAGDRLHVGGEPGWLTLLHKPTPPLRPSLRRGTYWRLLGQNAINHISLTQGKECVQAVQELLRLCDFSGSSPHPPAQQLASVNQKIIAGIRNIRSSAVMHRVKSGGMTGMCRGTELQVEFDEEQYTGTGVFLVASVLERFFALYTSVNSFTKLTVKTAQAEGSMKAWPPRAGTSRLR